MIKGIIEKVIISYFGKFIKGVQKQKLHLQLMSGKLQIENINLNDQFFDKLQMPIKLVYSSIGKLNLEVPLSKLTSSAVKCVLDNIFLIVEFKEEAFNQKQKNNIEQKKKRIQQYAKECFEEFLNKLKQQKKDSGIFRNNLNNITMKIIDNLQLKIVNFHIRFQQNIRDKQYACGITLQEILFTTTDQNWVVTFIDRSTQKNKNVTLYKTMDVKNLNIYWESKNVEILKTQDNKKIKQRMQNIISESNNQKIIGITSKFKLKINALNDFSKPIYQYQIYLEPIIVELNQLQVSQIIDFFEKLILFNELKLISKKKIEKVQNYQEFKVSFQNYISNFLSNQKLYKSSTQIDKIFQLFPLEELLIWTIPEVKKYTKKIKLNQLQQSKKSKGWFNISKENQLITPEELKQLQQVMNSVFEGQSNSLRPSSFSYFSVQLNVNKGKFIFFKNMNDVKQSLELTYEQFNIQFEKSQDDSNMEVGISIKDFNFDFIEYEEQQRRTNIIRNSEKYNNNQKQKFLKIKYNKKSQIQQQVLSTVIDIKKVICTYRKLYLRKFRQFFHFRSVDQILKSVTLEKFQKIKDVTQISLQKIIKKKNLLKITIISPTLIIPFSHKDQLQSQCWVANFGNFQAQSIQKSQNPLFQQYEFYKLMLKQVNLIYHPKLREYIKSIEGIEQDMQIKKEIFPVITDLNFQIDIKTRRPFIDEKLFSNTILDINLIQFHLKFTQKQFQNLSNLQNIFQQNYQDLLDEFMKQKEDIQKNKITEGIIKKKDQIINNWIQLYAILSGPYIYFYKDKKQLRYIDRIFIKNSKIQLIDDEQFLISNRYLQCKLKAENKGSLQNWKQNLEQKIKQYSTNLQLMQLYERQDQVNYSQKIQKQQKIYEFTFKTNKFQLSYLTNKNQQIANFKILNIEFYKTMQTSKNITKLLFQQIYIQDKLYIYNNPNYQFLISIPKSQSKSFILYEKIDSNSYQSINIQLSITELNLNWKPDVLMQLVGLVKNYANKNKKEKGITQNDLQFKKQGKKIDRDSVFDSLHKDERFNQLNNLYQTSKLEVKRFRQNYISLKNYEKSIVKNLKVQLSLKFQIKKVNINLIHRQSHIVLLNLIGQNCFGTLQSTQDEIFIEGQFVNLQLFDMTNYPRTNESSQIEGTKNRILYKKIKNNNSILKFKWASMNEKKFINKQRVNSFFNLYISPIEFHYYQQMTSRIIDYFLIQMLLLLTNPDLVVANQNLLNQIKSKQQVSLKPITVWGQYQQIIKKITSPYFIDMFIELKETQILLKSLPQSEVFFKLCANDIIVSNKLIRKAKRFQGAKNVSQRLINNIWQEKYQFILDEIQLKIVENLTQKPLAHPLNLIFTVDRLINEDEIINIFPQISQYDRSLYLHLSSNQLILGLNKHEYLQLLKLINFNITYDDDKDEHYIHNYKITQLIAPKPILFQINLPFVSVSAAYEVTKKNIETLFNLFIQNFQFTFKRSKELISNVVIKSPNLSIMSFKKGKQIPILKAPANSLNNQYIQICVQMKKTGQKIIKLNLESAKILLKPNIFKTIFQWINIDSSVSPVRNKYTNELFFCTNINQFIIAFQLSNQQMKQAIVALGMLSFKLSTIRYITQEYLQQMLKSGQMTIQQFQKIPEISYMSLTLTVEIFRCIYPQFMSEHFENVIKRNLINMTTLTFTDKKQLKIAAKKSFVIKTISTKSVHMDKPVLKISIMDLILIKNIIDQEQKHDPEYNSIIKLIKFYDGRELITDSYQKKTQKEIINNEESSLKIFQVQVQNFAIFIINNCKLIFVPVINIVFKDIYFNMIDTFRKNIIESQFSLGINYFNGDILKWEPFLQTSRFSINYSNYFDQVIKKTLIIQSTKQILLNISKQFVNVCAITNKLWDQQNKLNKQQFLKKKQTGSRQLIQQVSHFIIVNHIGYPIQIVVSKNKRKYRIQPLQQINFQTQFQHGQKQNQNIIISIKILHTLQDFKLIQKINLNSTKIRKIIPVCVKLPNYHYPIVLKPKYHNLKQFYYICSSIYILDTTTNNIQTPLPFDQNLRNIQLPHPHNISFSLQKLQKSDIQNHNFRYHIMFEHKAYIHLIKISHRFTVTNLLPQPIDVNGKMIQPYKSDGYVGQLVIQGENLNKTYYKVFNKKHQILIYCEAYVIDYYGLVIAYQAQNGLKLLNKKYIFNCENENYKYNIYILPSEKQKIAIRLNQGKRFSQLTQLSIGRVFLEIIQNNALCQFSVLTKLKSIYQNNSNNANQIFQKIIQITPRYIIVNSTQHNIKFSQIGSTISTTLEPFQRQPFFWENKTKPKLIKISAFTQNQFWGYSGPLSPQQNSECFTLRNSQHLQQYKILNCTITHTQYVSYINITEEKSRFRLANLVKQTRLRVYQNGILESQDIIEPKLCMFQLEYNQNLAFAYQFPRGNKKLIVEVEMLKKQFETAKSEKIQIELQSNLFEKRIYMSHFGKRIGFFLLKLQFQNNQKVLKLCETNQNQIEGEPQLQIKVEIPKFGISLIGKIEQKRTQLIYLEFKNVLFQLFSNKFKTEYNFKIGQCRLQNQRAVKVFFPVLIENRINPFLQFRLIKDNLNDQLIHYIGIAITKIVVSLSSQQIRILSENLRAILQEALQQQQKMIKVKKIYQKSLISSKGKFYFIESQIHPLKLLLTFKNVGQWGGKLFKTFSNLSQCQININGVQMKHFMAKNITQFFHSIADHYKQNILAILLPLIGNMSIIGNPVSFMNRIGVGVKDFFELPAEGFKQGPLAGGKGLVQGSKSLFKNTLQGALNSVQAITDTIGTGVASFVSDKKFLQRRDAIRNQRSEGIMQGIYNGGKSIYNGLENGVKGMVNDPLEGAQRNGVKGFVYGSLKGMTGLFLKPVSGLLDATTKTAQGIKNSANYLNTREKERRVVRIRPPRIFYTFNSQFKSYDLALAITNSEISNLNSKYENLHWCGYHNLDNSQKLLITYEYVMLYNDQKKCIQKQIESKFIVLCKEDHEFLLIQSSKVQKNGDMKINNEELKNKISLDINTIINYYHPNL